MYQNNLFAHFRGWIIAFVALLTMAGQANALRHIYYTPYCNTPYGYFPDVPLVSEADMWEPLKMMETGEGTNIYEATFELYRNSYFRFYSELFDDTDPANDINTKYYFNVITSVNHNDETLEPSRINGIMVSDLCYDKIAPPLGGIGTWHVEDAGKYLMRVDLQNNTITLIPAGMRSLIAIDSKTEPTDKEYKDYYAADGKYFALPAGDHELRFYDAKTRKWKVPASETVISDFSERPQFSLTESDNAGAAIRLSGWKGGTMRGVSGNKLMLQFNAGTGPAAAGDVVYVIPRDAKFIPDATSTAAELETLTTLKPDGKGAYTGQYSCSTLGNDVYFITKLGATAAQNTILTPPDGDRLLNVSSHYAYSRAKSGKQDNPAYFVWPKNNTDNVSITVNLSKPSDPFVKFSDFPPEGDFIYIIGTMTDWNAPSEANKELYKNFRLFATDKGGYYGHFTVDPTNAIFRFMTELGGWTDTYSIGSDPQDFYEAETPLTNGRYEGGLYKYGLGNWKVSGMTGTELYCYVNIDSYKVIFSESPIPEAGNVYEGAYEIYSDGPYITDDSRGFRYVDYVTINDDKGVYLHNRQLPITEAEPEWKGSYQLRPSRGAAVVDEYGVAEVPYTYQNYVTTDSEPIKIMSKSGKDLRHTYQVFVDPSNNKLYFEYLGYTTYLTGKLADNLDLDVRNRTKFSKYSYHGMGGMVYIPAGKFDFTPYNNLLGRANNPGEEEIFFTDGVSQRSQSENYGFVDKHVLCRDWQGGYVLALFNRYITPSAFKGLSVYSAENGELVFKNLNPTDNSGMRYSGRFKVDSSVSRYFYFRLAYGNEGEYIPVTSRTFVTGYVNISSNPNTTDYAFDGEWIINTDKSDFAANIGYNGNSFSLPTLLGEVEIEVEVDLERGTMKGRIIGGKFGNSYEIVSDNGTGLDGAKGDLSSQREGYTTISVISETFDEDMSFNIACSNGKVLVPTDKSTLYFDWYGVAKVPFKVVSAANADVRKAAAAMNKWNLNIPSGRSGEAYFMIDEKTNMLTVFVEAYNHTYIINQMDDKYQLRLTTENIEDIDKDVMVESSPGIYKGVFWTMPNVQSVSFRTGIYYGRSISGGWQYGEDSYTIDITEEDGTDTVLGFLLYMQMRSYHIRNIVPGQYKVTFDANENIVTLRHDSSEVKNIVSENDGLKVMAVTGGIRIDAATAATVPVYSLQGILMRTVDVVPGINFAELPAGIYICAGHKLMVR